MLKFSEQPKSHSSVFLGETDRRLAQKIGPRLRYDLTPLVEVVLQIGHVLEPAHTPRRSATFHPARVPRVLEEVAIRRLPKQTIDC